ncbi:hypothetical protein WA026_008511 [Henosepilachna vigintioctopunctata]|uniref:Uncharacterized protein n=1 Tax=Henosepilachna vigintioctopunctata TaxID=420089 RepID=A0AAW1UBG4_9CUCU
MNNGNLMTYQLLLNDWQIDEKGGATDLKLKIEGTKRGGIVENERIKDGMFGPNRQKFKQKVLFCSEIFYMMNHLMKRKKNRREEKQLYQNIGSTTHAQLSKIITKKAQEIYA